MVVGNLVQSDLSKVERLLMNSKLMRVVTAIVAVMLFAYAGFAQQLPDGVRQGADR